MRSRKPMSRPEAGEAPATFWEVAACFTEEEWRLLHHWQKQLYRNVMQEIHRAMSTLGPVIATSVFSLRPQDKDDLCGMDLLDVEIRSSINPASSDTAAEPETLFKQSQCVKDARGAIGMQANVGTNTDVDRLNSGNPLKLEEEVNSGSINRYCAEGESSKSRSEAHLDIGPINSLNIKSEVQPYPTDHLEPKDGEPTASATRFPFHNNEVEERLRDYRCTEQETSGIFRDSAGPEVTSQGASIGINEEGVTYAIDVEEYQTRESLGSCGGNARIKQRRYVADSVKCQDNLKLCRSTARKLWANVTQEVHERKRPTIQGWPGSDPELRVEEPVKWESVCDQLTDSSLYAIMPDASLSRAYAHAESTASNNDNIPGPSLESYQPPFPSESEPTSHNRIPTSNWQAHKGKGRYTCVGCGKSFSELSNLIRHERIHTGERPYHCTICGKNFNQKEVLLRHQNMHTGERPYHCDVCAKTFKRKDHLLGHRKIHTKSQLVVNTHLMETV